MSHSSPNTDRPGIGIAWMLATMFWFVALDAVAKFLMQDYPVAQVIWGRFFFHILFVMVVMGRSLPKLIPSQALGVQLKRSFYMFVTNALFFIGISSLPLTTASAIMFMGPLIVTVLAIPLLSETVGMRRWLGVLFGFIGAMVVIRPGGSEFQLSMVIVLIAAVSHSLYQIYTRQLGARDAPMTSLFYTGVFGAIVMSLYMPLEWKSVETTDWLLFMLLGGCGGVGHLCMIRAFRNAPASVVAPFSYTSLIWATLFGLVLFNELPDGWTLVGAAIIVASGLYVFNREQKQKQLASEETY